MSGMADRKREHLHLRLDTSSKRKLERAASYAETTTSQFVLRNALEAADRTIECHERIVLSECEWREFVNTLDSPPEPNASLKSAAKGYVSRMSE